MRQILQISLLLSFSTTAFSQDKFQQNDVYLEALGAGLLVSLNYEHQFFHKPGLGFRFGVGFYVDQAFYPTIPLGINYLIPIGTDGRSFLDAGITTTFTSQEDRDPITQNFHKTSVVFFIPALGFRRHTKSSLMYRINTSALIGDDGITYPYFGLSFGFRF